jgi:predicted nucleotidyltransferase
MDFSYIKDELVNGILDVFKGGVVKIILYGSVARNEDTAESDIDVAVILSQPATDDVRKSFISWSAGMDLKYDRVFSIIDIANDTFEEWKDVLPFYRNVMNEGVVLWTAA